MERKGRKSLFLTLLICLLGFASCVQYQARPTEITATVLEAKETPQTEYSRIRTSHARKIITKTGYVYVGMPKEELPHAGFTDLLQRNYRKLGDEEWITFSNSATPAPSDLITFYILDGKVKAW